MKSAASHLYSLDIIDNKTSMSWAIPLPSKDAAFSALHDWVLVHEVELGHKLSQFQIDNGELLSKTCHEFLTAQGYSFRLMAPYTLAHNGHVE